MSTLSIWQGDTIGGPTPAWLAPGIKFLHQIMSMNQCQELDVHKKPEPYPLTQNSLPNLRLFPSIWVPLLNCLMSYSALSRCVLTLQGFGVGNMKHQSSYQCLQIISQSESHRTHWWSCLVTAHSEEVRGFHLGLWPFLNPLLILCY